MSHADKRPRRVAKVIHHITCQHQVEIDLWPAAAEVYFVDEKSVDPANTQCRFEARIFNADAPGVRWRVNALDGSPGAGSIDASGLYRAPNKGGLPHGHTELVVAESVADPLRKAYARVTLMGFGPAPQPQPALDIFPRQATLFYPQGHHNAHIDESNTRQVFQAVLRRTAETQVEWFVDNMLQGSSSDEWFVYQLTGSGSSKIVTVKARLKNSPGVGDVAKVSVQNYQWPGLS